MIPYLVWGKMMVIMNTEGTPLFHAAFVDNCLYPLNCDSFPDDDDPNLCILEPDGKWIKRFRKI